MGTDLRRAEKNVLGVGRFETGIDEGIKWRDRVGEDGQMSRHLASWMGG